MMNHSDQTRAPFETTDLSLASFLRCRSFNIKDIKRHNGKSIFVFDDTSVLRETVLDYANDGAVQARLFCNTLRDLKALTR